MSEMILGLHDGHNAAVALFQAGRIVAAVQEERLTRVKNQSGIPGQAIADVFASTGISSSAIDVVALNGLYMTYDHFDREPLLAYYKRSSGLLSATQTAAQGHVC